MICHPLLLTAIGLSLQVQDTLQYDASIYGKITSADTTLVVSITSAPMPIPSVIIDIRDPAGASRQQTGDDTGFYSLTGLKAGVYTLRFTRTGYMPLTLDVRVPAHGKVYLDVTLDRAPPVMQTIKVLAIDAPPRIPGTPVATGAYRPWRMDGQRMRTLSSLDFPDVIRAMGTSPDAPAGPESGAGLHLQGGSTNHTLLLLDGIPLYNAIHAGDHPSAIDPDAVADITSYSEPRARTGGRLTGDVEINTVTALADSDHFSTSAWPTGIRSLAQLPLADGSALIGTRRDYSRPLERNGREPVTLRPTDAFATATVPFATGSLTGMVFTSADAISFDAGQTTVPVRDQSTNRFSWTSDARALTWHRDAIADASVVDVRIWQSGTSVGGNWLPASGTPIGMQNQFTQTAASTTISWGKTASLTSLGATVEQLRGGYAVSDSSRPDAFALLGISSRLHAVAAFIEHSHQLGPFTTTLGERVAMVDEKKFLLEPRVAFALAMTHGITLSGAFARSHQYTQSLYNDESVVDAMASLEVPVIASHGVPIASSTSGSMRLDVPIGFSALISAGTFARTFDDLVLAGATDGDPFAAHGFTAGHGEAYGGSLSMRDQVGRLDLQGLYTMTVVSREWAGEREYRPTFAPSADLLLSTGYHFGDNTVLRASGFMSAYRSTSPLYGAVAWEWQDMLASQREVSGSPQYSPAEVGVGRLAPYVRVDLGIRHTFAFGAPLRGRASIYANVDNLLDRRNAAGLIQDPLGNGTRTLGMMPRSLSFGLNLRF